MKQGKFSVLLLWYSRISSFSNARLFYSNFFCSLGTMSGDTTSLCFQNRSLIYFSINVYDSLCVDNQSWNAIFSLYLGIISTGIHGTPNNATSPTKKKNRRHGGRHAKSCEIDYGQICSDMEMSQGTPLSARRRFTHKRNKSGASKDLQFDKGTDTGKIGGWNYFSESPENLEKIKSKIFRFLISKFGTLTDISNFSKIFELSAWPLAFLHVLQLWYRNAHNMFTIGKFVW